MKKSAQTAVLFTWSSMALDLGSRAISVILSGLDGDGALGAEQINIKGGITIAQLPESAQFPSLPESAISSGQTRFILTPANIAEMIMAITAG